MGNDRMATHEKSISQLVEELTTMFIPIVSRLNQLKFGDIATNVSDAPELDISTYEQCCSSLVAGWCRLLDDEYHTSGLTCGLLDDRMLPREVSDQQLAEQFEGIGLFEPGTIDTDVELISAAFSYFKLLYCSDRDLPKQMVRLLELNHVTIDVLL